MTIEAPDIFGNSSQYADTYRKVGLAVVPAKDKHPIEGWRDKLHGITDFTHERWYGENGTHLKNFQMGFICGAAFNGDEWSLLVVDLDEKPHVSGLATWHQWLEVHNNGLEPETWTVKTGSGGTHLYFKYPKTLTITNTQSTFPGIDIRAQGGFIVAPPSRHPKTKKQYEWESAPWDCDIEIAPDWLMELLGAQEANEFDQKALEPKVKIDTPLNSTDAFGHMVDGRDAYMRDVVWAVVVDWYRDCPMPPSESEIQAKMAESYKHYEQRVRPQSALNTLEDEGRGWTAFQEKFRYAMGQWDGKVAASAAIQPKKNDKPIQVKNIQDTIDYWRGEANSENDPLPAPPSGVLEDDGTFKALNLLEMDSMPDPEWVIDNFIQDKVLSFLYGAPGTGKSFVALDMALHIAHGCRDWHGYKIKPGGALYVAGEGVSGYKLRSKAWHIKHGIEIDAETPFRLIGCPVNMINQEEVARLMATIRKHLENTSFVVIDTLARCAVGAEENSGTEMGIFIGECERLAREINGAVLVVHHSGKDTDRGMRGSSALKGSGQATLKLTGDTSLMQLVTEKQKDGTPEPPLVIKTETIKWMSGFEPKSSLVIDATQESVAHDTNLDLPSRQVLQDVLNEIDKAFKEGLGWSVHPQSRKTGRYVIFNMQQRWNIEKSTAEYLIDHWLANQTLKCVKPSERGGEQLQKIGSL